MPRTDLPVLVVTGLAREARLAAGPGVETVGAGGRPERLRALLEARRTPACRAVLSFGIAGGLDPGLAPGAIVVARAVVCGTERWTSDPDAGAALGARLAGLGMVVADLVGSDVPVMTVAEKARLHAGTGAAAVDMESHVAAAFAHRHGLPFAALRVVCDPAERALPAFAAQALTPAGEPDIRAVLGALLGGRARIGELVRLARDSGAAFQALGRCPPRLGPGLGLPARAAAGDRFA